MLSYLNILEKLKSMHAPWWLCGRWWKRVAMEEWKTLRSQERTLSLESQSIHLDQSSSTASLSTQTLSASNPTQLINQFFINNYTSTCAPHTYNHKI